MIKTIETVSGYVPVVCYKSSCSVWRRSCILLLYFTGVAALPGDVCHRGGCRPASCHSAIPFSVLTGVAALSGTSITGEVYTWVVVFLLPVNSAINPVLYTISTIKPLELLKKVNVSLPVSSKQWKNI